MTYGWKWRSPYRTVSESSSSKTSTVAVVTTAEQVEDVSPSQTPVKKQRFVSYIEKCALAISSEKCNSH